MTDTRQSTASGIDSYFKISERGSTLGTEVRAGVATFLVMSYIVLLNPAILSGAGYDPVAVAAGTALVAGVLSIAMGVVANYPLAMAAGLGINAAVAFGLVLGDGLSLAGAMGVIVLEGILVTVLVLAGLRERVMNAVPPSLKYAIAVGIGLFILFIGFVNGGLIRAAEGTPVEFIFPSTAAPALTLVGLLIAVVLYVRKVRGALVIAIVATSVVGLITGVIDFPDNFSASVSFDTVGEFDLGNSFEVLGILTAALTIYSFMLTDFFDTMGTATAIVEQADLVDEEGNIP
ncbi:MAG: NCS2 family permease, partial [Acidimicrobiia bacterium]|nr:NCS2 family permease [Acidimicrobiia bacterium]